MFVTKLGDRQGEFKLSEIFFNVVSVAEWIANLSNGYLRHSGINNADFQRFTAKKQCFRMLSTIEFYLWNLD